jgi:hypothetical protein
MPLTVKVIFLFLLQDLSLNIEGFGEGSHLIGHECVSRLGGGSLGPFSLSFDVLPQSHARLIPRE